MQATIHVVAKSWARLSDFTFTFALKNNGQYEKINLYFMKRNPHLSDVTAWIGFLLSFVPCMVAGILIFRLRERAENKLMQNALEKFKSGRPGEPAEQADD